MRRQPVGDREVDRQRRHGKRHDQRHAKLRSERRPRGELRRDGRRDRMLVTKDGTLIRIEEDVPPAVVASSSATPEIAIGDLPRPVRDTIRRQTDQVMVDNIETTVVADQTAYKVSYRTNNMPVELLVGTDGTVILPVGDLAVEGASAAVPAPAPVREETPVREVNVAIDTPDTDDHLPAAGVAASREVGGEADATHESEPVEADRPDRASTVTLADVPLQVQTTAKELAGGAVIESIAPKLKEGKVVYEITYSQDGRESTLTVNKDGQVQRPEQE